MSREAYLFGFEKRCEEAGVDPAELAKFAQKSGLLSALTGGASNIMGKLTGKGPAAGATKTKKAPAKKKDPEARLSKQQPTAPQQAAKNISVRNQMLNE